MRGHSMAGLIPAGFGAVLGGCAVAALAFPERTARVVVMAVAVGLFGVWARRLPAALATGVMAWCFATGFLVHGGGELAFGHDDLVRLAAFTVVAVMSWAGGQALHAGRRRRRLRRLMRARADARRVPVLVGRSHARPQATTPLRR
ncbi:hypothetical protein ITP53_04645 [Nonomuraea sp. K274]|uniref:DUF4118 domain-containing protein n=1 Tax=Nonomuraea cypriaca TaxID=1187855 RepID=A0A931A2I4_9ACTN|nr:hypothetical protein [Nonomuraea cypriaca]MBF8185037.1 hypothetical protein [Nonomuraea cypriaca]